MRRLLTVFETIATIILFNCVISPAFAETRVALVIGNGAYQNIARLPNPLLQIRDDAIHPCHPAQVGFVRQ
ncbi:hypothetical protein [Bradyrhizobium sp. STM 3557]|uniref:hypothetical protein n=1 Tax=Bradyrhizobium sp. STM 3557 TaxID=578920 RepID=UPI00388D699E